jgi:hypothetical protein
MDLNVDTWQEKESVERNDTVTPLVKEFLRELPDDYKKRYRKVFDDRNTLMERLAQFTLPIERIQKGELIAFSEIVGDVNKEFCCPFEYQNEKYMVGDRYCLNPEYNGNDVYLSFFRVEKIPSTSTWKTDEIFVASLSFKNKLKIVDVYSGSKTDANRIASLWHEKGRDKIEILQWRYEQAKKIGKRILDANSQKVLPPAIPEPRGLLDALTMMAYRKMKSERSSGKLSPNDPCPCGSGKKYKKCCGRKR